MPLIIRQAREKAGLNREEAARRVKVASQALYRVETGVQFPWPSLRRRLSDLYGIKECELFADIDAAYRPLHVKAGERVHEAT